MVSTPLPSRRQGSRRVTPGADGPVWAAAAAAAPTPSGAFYAFPRIEGCADSLALARRILAEAKVGTAAGYTFGAGNEGHLRLCFAISTPRLETALLRVREVLDRL